MERYVRRGLAVALMVIGLAACAESLAPTEPRTTPSAPAFSVSGGVTDTIPVCPPCPPGMMCAAVCEPSPQIELLPPADGDTGETDVAITPAPARASKSSTAR